MASTKTKIGYGLMALGLLMGFGVSIIIGHTPMKADIGYHAGMTYGLLMFGIGGVITNSMTTMVLGAISLLGGAFIIATYILRLGAAGLL